MEILNPRRVRLTVDLTAYHPNAKIGALGWTVPGLKCSVWGWNDQFAAVRLDEGGTLDVLEQSFEEAEG